jgi:hypothetical protein
VLAACKPSAGTASQIAAISLTNSAGGQSSGGAAASVPAYVERAIASACAEAPLIAFGETVRGVTQSRSDRFHSTCGFGATSGDAVYRFRLDRAAHVTAVLSGRHDTVLSLRGSCWDETSEYACNDDEERGTNSRIEANLPPGEYTLVVDGFGAENSGNFELRVDASAIDHAPPPTATIARVQAGDGVTVREGTGSGAITGEARFAKRTFTPRGLSRALQWLPAAHARVEVIDEGERVIAHGETDDRGAFSLTVSPGQRVRVRLQSRTTMLGSDIRVVSDPGTERTFDLVSAPFTVRGGDVVSFRAGVGGVEPAGAFNILANFVKYLPHVHRAFEGQMTPPLFAFWHRGNNRSLPRGSITAFLGPYARRSGAYALQIQGGDPGHEDSSDSDQFDDVVVLHEFSHYVIGTMAGHFSLGGNHPGHALFFPGLAMDEGFANALACAVAGTSRYWDSAGLEPEEPLAQTRRAVLIDEDIERFAGTLRGIGSQDIAQTLLWDLIDGAEGLPDADNDGVAIGITNALRVYRSFHQGDAPPAMNGWLERAVSLGVVTEAQARSIVHTPERLGFAFPVPAGERWPEELVIGGELRGRIDGRSDPAPSGGRNHTFNGYDASRAYLLRVSSRRRVTIELVIDGPGTDDSDTDLDLQLTTRDLRSIAQSAGYDRTERIERELEPGQYVILVRDGDMSAGDGPRTGPRGNRATFTLRAR